MDRLREFVYKYKIPCAIVVLLVSSFSIYYFAFANDDEYANQFDIVNATVEVEDGLENIGGGFDSSDLCPVNIEEPDSETPSGIIEYTEQEKEKIVKEGIDCANNDGIVRNFDEIKYNISYELAFSSESTIPDDVTQIENRTVEVEILLPADLSAVVSDGESIAGTILEPEEKTIKGKKYNLYKFEQLGVSLSEPENNIHIKISKINSKSGEKINPIIRLKEKTDSRSEEINEDTDLSRIKLDVREVTVSAKEKYAVKLYQGAANKKDNVTTFPVGVLVYLPYDENRGIRGIQVPENINFNINMDADKSTSSILEEETNPSIDNYDSEKYSIQDLAPSYAGEKNGSSSIDKLSSSYKINKENKSVFPVVIQNLKYQEGTVDIGDSIDDNNVVNYISSKMFIVKTQRDEKSKDDVTYKVSDSVNNTQISLIDNYVPYPADYSTKIDFINSSNFNVSGDQDAPVMTKSGEAIYNYGEEFYIQNTIMYGHDSGDPLENGFTNYIKIDNSAIKLINLENSSGNDYFVEVIPHNEDEVASDYTYNLKYGVGEWKKENFDFSTDASCPSNIDNITKEQLMDLYGGPCITEKEGKITWYDSIEDAAAENEDNRNKIIAVKFNMDHPYNLGAETIIRLKALAVENPNNIGKTFQVVSRGQAQWENSNGITYTHYLSETPKNSVVTQDYSKTVYSNGEIVTKDEPSGKYGNTIYVSAFKSSINKILVKDVYDSDRTEIYSGLNDPMEIIINPVIYKDSQIATIKNARIEVYLPKTIELLTQNTDKKPSANICEQQSNPSCSDYNIYAYDYTEDDIEYGSNGGPGTIENLIIHGNIKIDTLNNTPATIKAIISGNLKTNTDASDTTITYGAITPISQRTGTYELTLKNTRNVNSIGKTNTLYIDKNTAYTYNMRSVNLTNNATLEMLNILPFSGDSVGDGSKFEGSVSVAINGQLPSGYTAYYTTADPKTILANELSNSPTNIWNAWPSYNTLTNATAIKIVPTNLVPAGQYFAGIGGITITIKTEGNQETDLYENNFYMVHKNATVCTEGNNVTGECTKEEVKTTSYASSASSVSVFNRTISGMAFEDSSLDGLSQDREKRVRNMPVELYKLNKTEFNPKNPAESISSEDTLIEESVTNRKGKYSFKDLPAGNYYVKYTIDCERYTVTDKNKQDPTVEGDTSLNDSDANLVTIEESTIEKEDEEDKDEKDTDSSTDEETTEEESPQTCYAVSNIITLDNSNIIARSIDIGLRPRQEFDIKLKKYITRVDVNSSSGSKTYKYNNETKVKIDIKNLKNTSFRVKYGIELENSRFFPGTIGNIVETIPEGMTFNPNLPENDGWYESNGSLYYSGLKKTLIRPGEKYHLTIVLDLKTDNGGDYINFVAARNLQIMPTTTNFGEIKQAEGFEIIPDEELEKLEESTEEDKNDKGEK